MIEALSDPRISSSRQQWDSLIMTGLDSESLEGSIMFCLGRLPPLMWKGRKSLSPDTTPKTRSSIISSLQQDLRSLHHSFQPILSKLRTRWYSVDEMMGSGSLTSFQKRFIHCGHLRLLAFALAIGLVIDNSLVTLTPTDMVMKQEIVQLVDEIVDLADVVVIYRPLGHLSTAVSLGTALTGINAVGSLISVARAAELTTKIETRLEDDLANLYGETVKITDEDREKYRRPFTWWTPE